MTINHKYHLEKPVTYFQNSIISTQKALVCGKCSFSTKSWPFPAANSPPAPWERFVKNQNGWRFHSISADSRLLWPGGHISVRLSVPFSPSAFSPLHSPHPVRSEISLSTLCLRAQHARWFTVETVCVSIHECSLISGKSCTLVNEQP